MGIMKEMGTIMKSHRKEFKKIYLIYYILIFKIK